MLVSKCPKYCVYLYCICIWIKKWICESINISNIASVYESMNLSNIVYIYELVPESVNLSNIAYVHELVTESMNL